MPEHVTTNVQIFFVRALYLPSKSTHCYLLLCTQQQHYEGAASSPSPPAELKTTVFTRKTRRLRSTQTLLHYLASETLNQSPAGGVIKHFECRPAI